MGLMYVVSKIKVKKDGNMALYVKMLLPSYIEPLTPSTLAKDRCL